MAVTDRSAVRFSNEKIRVAADMLGRLHGSAQIILQEFPDVASLIPDDPAEVIEDGAPANGRTQITGADVHRIIEALNAIVSVLDGTASNGQTHRENVLKVAVNPEPRVVRS